MITSYNEIYQNPFTGSRPTSPTRVTLKCYISNIQTEYHYIGKLILKYNFWHELQIVRFEPHGILTDYEETEGKLITFDLILRDNMNLKQVIKEIEEMKPHIKLGE